jgi:hypothetical protein
MPRLLAIAALTLALAAPLSRLIAEPADDPVLSGPQPGEELPALNLEGVYGDEAGQSVDFVSQADGKPLLLVFVHPPLTRPSALVTRTLTRYASERADDGLHCGVAWLAEDPNAAQEYLVRVRESLDFKAPLAISPDGKEGPGDYGLNRQVSLTVVVANEGKVSASFALVQPSLTDVPKVLEKVVELIGGEVPPMEKLAPEMARGTRPARDEPDPRFRELLRAVIKRGATPEQVAEAVKKVDEYVGENEERRKELGRITSTIVNANKLSDYGTEAAQVQIKKWAELYGSKDPPPP